ncbi:hypothetical protein [Ureibacillus sp. FSL K6-2830]|uniref:hypothetical protein n=1 Tax=Ureibacillus sp. FSL K6-2830 TaxID=2954610 RepID=UPI0030FB3EF6
MSFGINQEVSASVLTKDLKDTAIADSKVEFEPAVDYENLQVTNDDGSIILFDNLEDMEIYLTTSKELQSGIGINWYGETVVGTEYKWFHFMGYSKHTPSWRKASEHHVNSGETETFSATVKTEWGDVTASYTRTTGVTSVIPADPSRYSRLGGFADLKIERIKTTQPSFGTRYSTKVKVLDTYIDVVYK